MTRLTSRDQTRGNFGTFLLQRREELGYRTRYSFANYIGVGSSHIQKWENLSALPREDSIRFLALALEVTVTVILEKLIEDYPQEAYVKPVTVLEECFVEDYELFTYLYNSFGKMQDSEKSVILYEIWQIFGTDFCSKVGDRLMYLPLSLVEAKSVALFVMHRTIKSGMVTPLLKSLLKAE